jgi:hypothetical protein
MQRRQRHRFIAAQQKTAGGILGRLHEFRRQNLESRSEKALAVVVGASLLAMWRKHRLRAGSYISGEIGQLS